MDGCELGQSLAVNSDELYHEYENDQNSAAAAFESNPVIKEGLENFIK